MHILSDRHSNSFFIHFNLIISLLSQNSVTSSLWDFPFHSYPTPANGPGQPLPLWLALPLLSRHQQSPKPSPWFALGWVFLDHPAMGGLSVLICFGYLQGECIPGSLVLYFRKRYNSWPPNAHCIPSAIDMATHQEQLDCIGGDGSRIGGCHVSW